MQRVVSQLDPQVPTCIYKRLFVGSITFAKHEQALIHFVSARTIVHFIPAIVAAGMEDIQTRRINGETLT